MKNKNKDTGTNMLHRLYMYKIQNKHHAHKSKSSDFYLVY